MTELIKREEQSSSEHIVAFIDLLGFTSALKNGRDIDDLFNLLRFFINLSSNEIERPIGTNYEGNQTFEIKPSVTAFSDCIVISFPLGGLLPSTGILMEINRYLGIIAVKAIEYGFLIRGGISSGRIHHQDNVIIGLAYIEAIELEKLAKMPRIIIHEKLFESPDLPKPAVTEPKPTDLILVEQQDDKIIYSLNYFNQMCICGIPSGDSWWSGVRNRIDHITLKIVDCTKEIKVDNKPSEDQRDKNLLKWSWFKECFEQNSDFWNQIHNKFANKQFTYNL